MFLWIVELISRHKSVAHVILPEISEYWSYVKDDPPARAALIWIYGEYGEVLLWITWKFMSKENLKEASV